MNRFTKISVTGEPLPDDATDHVAVLDNTTGLMWSARDAAPESLQHAQADAACKALSLAGFSDWQLPNVEQLFALADRSRHSPAIDTRYFVDCQNDWYWTNTPAAWSPSGYAWFVYFGGGLADLFLRGLSAFVRAVRVASPAGQ